MQTSNQPRPWKYMLAGTLAGASGAIGLMLAVKLGLHQFLNDHADAASVQVDSAYSDLVRLTGHDPATEICNRFEREAA